MAAALSLRAATGSEVDFDLTGACHADLVSRWDDGLQPNRKVASDDRRLARCA
jgi:hypothetical protein